MTNAISGRRARPISRWPKWTQSTCSCSPNRKRPVMRRKLPSCPDLLASEPHDLSITDAPYSQRVKPGQKFRTPPPPRGPTGLRRWIDLFERFSFGLQICARVVIGRVQLRVPEPIADHGHIDTGCNELNADAVTPRVRRDALCGKRGHVPGGR